MLARSLRVFVPLAVAMACAAPALAHPIGNFTINHLSELRVRGGAIGVTYVLDMAEIPTYSVMREADSGGRMNAAQLQRWASTEAATLAPSLGLSAGNRSIALALDGAAAHTRPGAGGLPILYLVARYHGYVPAGSTALIYRDGTFAGRLGWKDVIVEPATEPTHELTAYPSALLGSPRSTTAVDIALAPSGAVAAVKADATQDATAAQGAAPSAVRSNTLSDMLARGAGNPFYVALVFLTAIALGALHALEPGHGKTLLAISLVGARATVKQATILASSLTVAHTIGVLALGLAISIFKSYFVPEAIYPWITLLSGIVIAIVGARALQRQVALRQPFAHAHAHAHDALHRHAHEHEHHPHSHPHPHPHAHDDAAHAHGIPGNAPLRFGATVWAAMSGGVAPCPAALVVLLAAIALNQVAYGIFVIVAFSFGLAATLTALGIVVVRGAGWLQRRPQFDAFVTYGPLVSPAIIATIGAVMVGQGFAAQGIAISPLAVSALAALGILGFAFSHPFAHRRVETA
jgi:ABC-type nickel/cobalt efflux system permease component RcnA